MDYRKLLETLSNADHDELLDNIDNAICAITNLFTRAEAAEARAEEAERERDAAVSDLETIMAYESLDTRQFCKNNQCRKRGGIKLCVPKWRGIKVVPQRTGEEMSIEHEKVCPLCHGNGKLPTWFYGIGNCSIEDATNDKFPLVCHVCLGKMLEGME